MKNSPSPTSSSPPGDSILLYSDGFESAFPDPLALLASPPTPASTPGSSATSADDAPADAAPSPANGSSSVVNDRYRLEFARLAGPNPQARFTAMVRPSTSRKAPSTSATTSPPSSSPSPNNLSHPQPDCQRIILPSGHGHRSQTPQRPERPTIPQTQELRVLSGAGASVEDNCQPATQKLQTAVPRQTLRRTRRQVPQVSLAVDIMKVDDERASGAGTGG